MIRVFLVERQPQLATLLSAKADSSHLKIIESHGIPAGLPVPARNSDVILLGPALESAQALELIHCFKDEGKVPIAVVTSGEPHTVLPFLEAGASGYVRADAPVAEILGTIQSIHDGHPPFSPEVATALVERMNELVALQSCRDGDMGATNEEPVKLSAREVEILQLVAAGLSNQEIATQLTIEIGTVKNHVHSILKKLGVSSRNQAVRYYAGQTARQGIAAPTARQEAHVSG